MVAATAIAVGKPIQVSQIRLESYEGSPLDETAVHSVDEVVGYLRARRSRLSDSQNPDRARPDVARGDLVDSTGHCRRSSPGWKRAETAGATGSTILVRNLSSGKDFRAQVTGKDAAEIQ